MFCYIASFSYNAQLRVKNCICISYNVIGFSLMNASTSLVGWLRLCHAAETVVMFL